MRPPFTARRRAGTRVDAPYGDVDPLRLASVSHELRTPMSGLIGMLELLSRTALTAEQDHLVRIAHDAARALVRVADDVLDLSKAQAGRIEIEMLPVDIVRLIEDVTALLRAENKKPEVRIDADIDPRLHRRVSTDPTRLRQILLNIACNALKFTHTGTVTVRARLLEASDAAQRLRISVADTGIGMSRASLRRVWEPFAQARASTARVYGGTGLGLTIARQLASRLGGRLSMCSRLGKGTTAYLDLTLPTVAGVAASAASARAMKAPIRVPMYASAVATAPSSRLSPAWPNGPPTDGRPGFRLLIADDDPTHRLMVEQQLAQLGYAFDVAQDGAAAFDCLRRCRYDLLLTDLRMPGLDGLALATRWRALEAAGALPMPVIGLTANPHTSSCLPSEQDPIDDRLTKPVSLQPLAAALHTWLVDTPSLVTGWQAKAIAALREQKVLRPNVNVDQLQRHFGGVVTLSEVAATFVRTTQADLAALLPYVDGADDSSPCRRACSMRLHRITGGLQVMGQHRLAQTGAALETALEAALRRDASDARFEMGADMAADGVPADMHALRDAIEAFGIEVTCHLDWLARQCPR